MRQLPGYIASLPEIQPLLAGANHIDIKKADGAVSLREFVAGALSYQPGWVTFLYRVRGVFVRLLGLRQNGVPRATQLRPEQVPMQAGARAGIFQVGPTQEEVFWSASAADTHLTAHIVVVAEPLGPVLKRFYLVTIVHYHKWTGPVYFNVIRPFHHLVVGEMVKAGIKPAFVPQV